MSIQQGIPLTNGEVPKLIVDDYSAYQAEKNVIESSRHENLYHPSNDRRRTTAVSSILRSSAQKSANRSIDRSLLDPEDSEDEDEDEEEEDEYEVEEGLGHVLRNSGHQHFDIRVKHFWTDDVLARTMTKHSVAVELQRYKGKDPALFTATPIETIADNILKHRRKIFAVLALLEKGACIEKVIAEGLVDKDLPLHTDGSSSCPLYRVVNSRSRKVRCFSRRCDWNIVHREKFLTSQYAMSPQFLGFGPDGRTPKHEEFSPEVVLPIMQENERQQGGYGVIKKIKIAPTCHGFHNRLRLIKTKDEFALKRLFKNDFAEFRREAKAGEQFNGFVRDHLVTLLMTWTLNDQYYLLFPLARYDLEDYWSHFASPLLSPGMTRWMLKQIVGITKALGYIHDPSDSQPTNNLGVPDDRKYGRHGDLKPDNLLVYDSHEDCRGIVLVADLGLATLNSVVSRTQSNTKTRCGPRYKAPEFNIKGFKIRRSCDIWALGCVLIEWVCWALEGNAVRLQFLEDLFQPFLSGSQTDLYFKMERRHHKVVDVTVNQAVTDKAAGLHSSKRCTQFFHDLLWLIQDKMIVVREEHRISAQELQIELKKMTEKGERDSEYFDTACEMLREVRLPLPLQAEFYVQETKREAINQVELDVPV